MGAIVGVVEGSCECEGSVLWRGLGEVARVWGQCSMAWVGRGRVSLWSSVLWRGSGEVARVRGAVFCGVSWERGCRVLYEMARIGGCGLVSIVARLRGF